MTFTVRELSQDDEAAFLRGFKEWEGEDLSWYTFEFRFNDKFSDHLVRLYKNKMGIDLDPRFVPSTLLYGFLDGEIVGRVSVRHHLNEYLSNVGGHIGYAVAPRFRKMGLADNLLKQAINYCRIELGLNKILITCDDDNIPSIKLIEKNNGLFENQVKDKETQKLKRRYWITL
jgi:predicted acetyltransferase